MSLSKGRTYDLHVVLCHKLLVGFGIDTLPPRKHLLEPAGRYPEQQYTGLGPDVLERVRSFGRNKQKGPRGRAYSP